MVKQYEIKLPEFERGFHLITNYILNQIDALPEKGIFFAFIQHTSAGLTINENADPTVRTDFEASFNHMVKENEPFYQHIYEGSDDMPAHIKATLTGSSVTIPITNHQLNLGIWQGIYLCEFRNLGGSRKVVITIYS